MSEPSERSPWSVALRLGLLVTVIVVAAWFFHAQGLSEALHRQWIDEHVLGQGARGWLIFAGLAALLTSIGVPRQVPSFLAGYAFGALLGTLIAALATAMGSACSFFYARLLGRGVIPRRVLRRMQKIESLLCGEPFKMAIAIRFLPLGNNLATNLIAGVSRVSAPRFLLGSLVGFLPQTLIFALMGKGFRVDPFWRVGLALVLLVISTWIGRRMYRNFRRRQKARRDAEAGSTASSALDSGLVDSARTS
jgi:uncharacterized membrane protein YdjX (TVP38/TMEM64 family)